MNASRTTHPRGRGDAVVRNRTGRALSLHDVRCTFREFLRDAGFESAAIELSWCPSTVVTVIARGDGDNLTAGHLGQGSTAITHAHYIESDLYSGATAPEVLGRILRAEGPDVAPLSRPGTTETDEFFVSVEAGE